MRTWILIGICAAATTGCGSDNNKHDTDGPSGNRPPPRVIGGGGIGDGAINGVVNLYVIDDATRSPVSGATVRVGTIDGTTDATGLFVADGLVGPQTIAIKAAGYRSELMIGVNGANVTSDLHPALDPAPTKADLTGSITGFDAITVPTGHSRMAWVSYSHDDTVPDAENNLTTASNGNICDSVAGGCSFKVTARTGHVALLAVILDHDSKGTPDPADDSFTVIGWAARTGITVQNGVNQTGQDLSLVDVANLGNLTVGLGTPPSGLFNVLGVVGIDLGGDGVLYLFPELLKPGQATVLGPKLAAFPGSTYRLTAFANNDAGVMSPTIATAIVQRHGLTQPALSVGTWMAPPTNVSMSRTGGSWQAVVGAAVQGVNYDTDSTHHLLSVTVVDGSLSFTIPDLVALPASGPLTATVTALGGMIDVMSFAIDADRNKIETFSSQPVTVN